MTVPRGTLADRTESRLSVRVEPELKRGVSDAADELNALGLRTTASELVSMFVQTGLDSDPQELEHRLLAYRRDRVTASGDAVDAQTAPKPEPRDGRRDPERRRPPGRPEASVPQRSTWNTRRAPTGGDR